MGVEKLKLALYKYVYFIATIQNNENYNEKSKIFFRKTSKVLSTQKYAEREL